MPRDLAFDLWPGLLPRPPVEHRDGDNFIFIGNL